MKYFIRKQVSKYWKDSDGKWNFKDTWLGWEEVSREKAIEAMKTSSASDPDGVFSALESGDFYKHGVPFFTGTYEVKVTE